jgi:XTP/dITP diphosphohydrolase
MKTIWVATGNLHKLEEISHILGPDYQLKSFKDLAENFDVEENGHTYQENAEIKARALFNAVRQPVFADDSGLEVDALNGEPGINSARYSGVDTNHERNIDKLLDALKEVGADQRTARFRCLISYIDENGTSHYFEGIFPGRIGFERAGNGGFGYDPIFFPEGSEKSVAEYPAEEKNRISHRGLAVEKLKKFLEHQG